MKKLLFLITGVLTFISLHSQTNIINNGTFDGIEGVMGGATDQNWGMWTDAGATIEVVNGIVNVFPGTPNVEPWHAQLEQKNLVMENGTTYTITFKAWAQAERVIQLTLEDPNNGYRLIGISSDEGTVMGDDNLHNSKWDVNITKEPTTYTRNVTVDRIVENTMIKFAFLMSQTSDSVYIDDVSIIAKDATPNEVTLISNNISIYPNPAKDYFILKGNKGNVIKIFNVNGSLLMSRILTSSFEKIDINNLNSGIYFIKEGNNYSKLVVQ